MAGGCNIDFDENDDLVISDIPDEIMAELEPRARLTGREVEDEMRDLALQIIGAQTAGQESPLPRGRGLGEGDQRWARKD